MTKFDFCESKYANIQMNQILFYKKINHKIYLLKIKSAGQCVNGHQKSVTKFVI